MKKIFFDNRYIIFTDHVSVIPSPHCPTFDINSEAELNAFLKLFLQDDRPCYQLISKDVDLSFKLFKQNFKIVEAAGGAVLNENGELLIIERLGKWDLPKGHIEKGEKAKEAALREVEEECGVTGLSLDKKICTTWHSFPKNGIQILKKTYWYLMFVEGVQELVPQLDEGITKVEWRKRTELDDVLSNTWKSLLDVFEEVEKNVNR